MSTTGAQDLARLRAEIVNARDVPTIPVLLLRILRVVDGERASAKDLVDLMQRDQALAGRVLRLANSGFFACAREVGTLSRAVMLLGFSTVKNLALGVKILETLRGRGGPGMAALWEHSALVGAAARAIAQRTRAADPEEVFTAGLLHDIGKVILRIRFEAVYDGFDPNSNAAYIFFNYITNVHMEESAKLAAKVQSQFATRVGRKDRGVKQAGYLVLWRASKPAILIETGFISNSEEEKFLNSENGKTYMASAIYRAIREYNGEAAKEVSGESPH